MLTPELKISKYFILYEINILHILPWTVAGANIFLTGREDMKWITFFHQVYVCISELGKAKLKSISMGDPLCPTSRRERETGIPEKTKRGSGV